LNKCDARHKGGRSAGVTIASAKSAEGCVHTNAEAF
jgi:hypothetical protein